MSGYPLEFDGSSSTAFFSVRSLVATVVTAIMAVVVRVTIVVTAETLVSAWVVPENGLPYGYYRYPLN